MANGLKHSVDMILKRTVTGTPRVPGVVAVIMDRTSNLYEGVAGERALASGIIVTADTVMALFSDTKAITGTAVMQCVEEGKLDLDAPAKGYAPDIGKLQVLEGFDSRGSPKLRAPKRDITTRMLMLHTAGFGYDFFNRHYRRLATNHGQPSVTTASKAAIMTPLLFDPGDRWECGTSIDCVGRWWKQSAESGLEKYSRSASLLRSECGTSHLR